MTDGGLPDLGVLRQRFAATAVTPVPDIVVALPPIASYDALLPQTTKQVAPHLAMRMTAPPTPGAAA